MNRVNYASPQLDEETDEDYFRNKELQAYRENCESGFIGKEECGKLVESMDVFGKIVE